MKHEHKSLRKTRGKRAAWAKALVVLLFWLGYHGVIAQPYKTITIERIASRLPSRPISVGFDVDETVLFSTPGFYYGLTNNDGPDGTNKYGDDPLSNPMFWADLNGGFDRFSIPKQSAVKLIEVHKKRGDTIYFITARPGSPGEKLTTQLNRIFGLSNRHPVMFADDGPKSKKIEELGLAIFYGDSDSDRQGGKLEPAESGCIRGRGP